MNQDVKQISKKRSAFEAIFGISFKTLVKELVLVSIVLVVILGFFYVHWKLAECFFLKYVWFQNVLEPIAWMLILLTIALFILCEIVSIVLLHGMYVLLFKKIPLLLNLRYLPLTEKEILSLDFKSNDEFYKFVERICCKGDYMCDSSRMRVELRQLVRLYMSAYKKNIEDFYKDLSIGQLVTYTSFETFLIQIVTDINCGRK